MSRTDKRGWNRGMFTRRLGARYERPGRTSEAECYLTMGRIMHKWLRRGYAAEMLARRFKMPLQESLLAFRYADGSPALILRALVEGWPWDKIKQSLPEPQGPERASRSQL